LNISGDGTRPVPFDDPPGVSGAFHPAAATCASPALTLSAGAAVAPGGLNLTVAGSGCPGHPSTPLPLAATATSDAPRASPPAAPTGTSSALTVSVGAAVAPGVYNLTVAGSGTPGNRSTPLSLTVSATPDYALSLAPAALTIGQGATGTSTVTITRTNFAGAVTLSLG